MHIDRLPRYLLPFVRLDKRKLPYDLVSHIVLPFTRLDQKKTPYDLVWEDDQSLSGKVEYSLWGNFVLAKSELYFLECMLMVAFLLISLFSRFICPDQLMRMTNKWISGI